MGGLSTIRGFELKKELRWIVVFVTVIPMTLVAQYFHRSDLIFPEAAALTIGTWGGEAHAWSESKLKLAILPPMAATVAVLLNWIHLPVLIGFSLMVVVIPIALDLLKSPLIPTISAGALPSLFQIKSPWFLVVVAAITVTLGAGLYIGEQISHKSSASLTIEKESNSGNGEAWSAGLISDGKLTSRNESGDGDRLQDDIDEDLPKSSVARRRMLAWFIAISICWTFATWWSIPHAALAPPILVSFYEWLKSSDRSGARYLKRWATITSGIVIGTIVHQVLANFVLAALLAVAISYLAMKLLREVHPPTLAISLLPLIFPGNLPYVRAFDVSLAVAVLYGLGLYLPRLISHRRWTIDRDLIGGD